MTRRWQILHRPADATHPYTHAMAVDLEADGVDLGLCQEAYIDRFGDDVGHGREVLFVGPFGLQDVDPMAVAQTIDLTPRFLDTRTAR